MRLDYLRYFDHLAEVLNYTRAAEDLYIAQPTLSVAIKRMEKELGIKLFQRSEGSMRIELTSGGDEFFGSRWNDLCHAGAFLVRGY